MLHKHSVLVPAPFCAALSRARSPIIITYAHKETLQNLATTAVKATQTERETPAEFKDKVSQMRTSLLPIVQEFVQSGIHPWEMERLALELLKRDKMESVVWTAGPWERGADGICEIPLAYGLKIRLAVQVKQHRDISYDQTGLDQLDYAFNAHGAQTAILVNTAQSLGPDVLARIDTMKQTKNIEVIYGNDLYQRILELLADPVHTYDA